MSYSVYSCDPVDNELMLADQHQFLRGKTYAPDGRIEEWVGIPYNYNSQFCRLFGEKGIGAINGLTGKESIPVIKTAISRLDDDVNSNYWIPTDGNVKQALNCLLRLAASEPYDVWNND